MKPSRSRRGVWQDECPGPFGEHYLHVITSSGTHLVEPVTISAGGDVSAEAVKLWDLLDKHDPSTSTLPASPPSLRRLPRNRLVRHGLTVVREA